MNKDQILEFLKNNKNFLREKYGVKSIGLFGSIATGKQNDVSDIDLVIDVEKKFKKYELYLELKFFVSKNTGREVDLVYKNNVNPVVKYAIAKDLIYA